MGKATHSHFEWGCAGILFLLIPILPWNFWLFGVLGLAGLAIAFRIAPFLAIMTELVPSDERGTVLALRVALSQLGIALTTYLGLLCISLQRIPSRWILGRHGIVLVVYLRVLFRKRARNVVFYLRIDVRSDKLLFWHTFKIGL